MRGDGFPVLLTVEEAGELLRIGRTKAYAMAREWRETDGRSGLPVIDLGHVLRVPRRALEELIGTDLTDGDSPHRVDQTKGGVPAAEPPDRLPMEPPGETLAQPTPMTGPARGRQHRIEHQSELDPFDAKPRSS